MSYLRNRQLGFALVATLISLVLIASLALSVVKLTTANASVVKRLTRQIHENAARSSAYELLRPYFATTMLSEDVSVTHGRDPELQIEVDGFFFDLLIQDTGGVIDILTTPVFVAEQLLAPTDLAEYHSAKDAVATGVPLKQFFDQSNEQPRWLTHRSGKTAMNVATIHSRYITPAPSHHFREQQITELEVILRAIPR